MNFVHGLTKAQFGIASTQYQMLPPAQTWLVRWLVDCYSQQLQQNFGVNSNAKSDIAQQRLRRQKGENKGKQIFLGDTRTRKKLKTKLLSILCNLHAICSMSE
ncbi:hypothetical protein MEM_03480 [Candida albicans L26]|uniref:Uncharacterized protein n=1 Tax=Candida albicans P78048 TaxID=1094989 RepID=A0AB34PU65_CANAX|nr:hypothetical protein MEO_03433 [Candida albicans P94015]KGQ90187.1 hypothetical protein MEU_03474 [Candida albicans P37005]KGR09586.1 hypothetical protein MG3_03507 [Candida albicans P78048]KGR16305.1 hypothetical protein MG9_03462 [Candida albicans P37037]KGT68469.1 hypothetical protein MEK_03489 [Candida albicans 12C]KGU07700.1 hypothetical protein MEQ_03454 [Candida albicans P87]KGU09213.1 hypothetical protein MEY_03450 [Candida albicans 19F]KGU09711.1 hypothetical protein MEM_03480 [C